MDARTKKRYNKNTKPTPPKKSLEMRFRQEIKPFFVEALSNTSKS